MPRVVKNVDPELERLVRLGDRRAFEELAERHYDTIFRVTRRLIRDYHLSQDLAQEALLRAYAKLGRLAFVEVPFVAIVSRIARNIAIDVLRRKRLGVPQSLDALPEHHAPESVHEPSPEHDDDHVARVASMWGAMTQLRESERGILLMRYARGLDMRSIATEYGITVASAKARLHRGRRELAARMQELPQESDEPE